MLCKDNVRDGGLTGIDPTWMVLASGVIDVHVFVFAFVVDHDWVATARAWDWDVGIEHFGCLWVEKAFGTTDIVQ